MNPHILKKPILTEKTLAKTAAGCFTFEVAKGASKHQIKTAIEAAYGVNVLGINTSTITPRPYRQGRRGPIAHTTAGKKAVIKLKKGQTIDLFDISTKDK